MAAHPSLGEGIRAAAIGLAFALVAVGAVAAPPDCRLIAETPSDKFVMGAVIGEGADDPLLSIRLEAALNMEFEAAGTQLVDEARIVFCEDRWVDNESEYDADVARGLNDKRVLIEVWARAAPDLVVVSFVVIPLRHYEFFEGSNANLTGFHRAVYGRDAAGGSLPELFTRMPELRALTALALGLRYEKKGFAEDDLEGRAGNLDTARRFYCEAERHLAALSDGLRPHNRRLLVDYTRAAAERVAAAAVANADPSSALPIVASERARDAGTTRPAACLVNNDEP